jgi:predicted PurR-regulated permease PerM
MDTKAATDRHIFYLLASALIAIAILYLGKPILIPLAFALLLSFVLYPICTWLEKEGIRRLWAIIWTMTGTTLVFSGLVFLFSSQLFNLSEQFSGFTNKLNELLVHTTTAVTKFPLAEGVSSRELMEKGKDWIANSGDNIMSNTLSVTTAFLSGAVIVGVCTFLILLYRSGFRKALLQFAAQENRDKYNNMFQGIQKVGQQYVAGMGLLILILGTLNTVGLLVLGIKYAVFFGFLAGLLSIIPYIGTILGAALPAMYAFVNSDSYWYPAGVVLVFAVIQFVEGNYLTPKIVGGNLRLNALVAVVSLMIGGMIWGVPGMILSLPFTAIIREFCKTYPSLQPLTFILGDNICEPT